ncbi:hypothetical protein ABT168_36360 [Streptomyces sp. NPDC001793]|uniref:hypothetical protein n=1 Tax=Streptomyces sp. NPDC001793 TaxID=3154657 RepID=UPI00332F1A2A
MARRPLPRILTGSAPVARGRELARSAADGASDVLQPLITVSRGLRRLTAAGRGRWAATPKEQRGTLCFLVGGVVVGVALVPYGPLLALLALAAVAAWVGRAPEPEAGAETEPGPSEAETGRLQALYEALVPGFSFEDDPGLLYAHDGDWQEAFTEYAFDEDGRPARLCLKYPAYFPDGEADARARVEQLLHAKSGRGREYRFDWREETNQLVMTALGPLPADIAAQRFVVSPGETVLGFTDPESVQRTLPVRCGEEERDVPPVVWRTGRRSAEPHLLALSQPGAGGTTLLRSIALQALQDGDVVVIDGGGTGEFGSLAGRHGVLAVESGLAGALAALEWAAHETERRLVVANRAQQAGRPTPASTRRPLWIIADKLTALSHLAAVEGRGDPQRLLQVPLRHGRAAQVTVAVADQFETAELLGDPVRTHTKARVVLGPATAEEVRAVLGAPPSTTPLPHLPPGRGYARLGGGPVLRLQVPATPDPFDEAGCEAHRQAVLELLPKHSGLPAEGALPAHDELPAHDAEPADDAVRPVSFDKHTDAAPVTGD